MNLVGIAFTLVSALVVLIAPRRWAVLGVMAAICYITQGQAIPVAGLNFTAIRMVLLAGLIRILARGEFQRLKLNVIDWAIVAYAIFSCVVAGLRHGVWQEPLGVAYNILLSYFVFRCLVTSWEEAQELVGAVAVLIIPFAMCMLLESVTGKNVFSGMGGQGWDGKMREGRYRCMASFRGAHSAGIFGATLVPLFAGLFFAPGRRGVAVAGLIAATVITYTSNSSAPLMAYLSSLVGLFFWSFRLKMKKVRWGIVAGLVGLALVMKAPIWYIFSKLSAITGGDGWHRSYLMDQCFKHFSDWWFMGTDNTSEWAATVLSTGGADLTNQYVSCAANGGLAVLILFVLILIRCFQSLGTALKVTRGISPQAEVLLWCLGSALFAHVVTLFSITYYDQMDVAWWALLAMISSSTADVLKGLPRDNVWESVPEPSYP